MHPLRPALGQDESRGLPQVTHRCALKGGAGVAICCTDMLWGVCVVCRYAKHLSDQNLAALADRTTGLSCRDIKEVREPVFWTGGRGASYI